MDRLVIPGVIVLCAAVAACAYPRRSTSLSPAQDVESLGAPAHVWQLRFASGTVPPKRPGGLDWDPGGGLPDVVARLYRGGELIFETPVQQDTLTPTFDVSLPRNVWLPPSRELRLEMWDRDDGPTNQPIGIWRGQGLPPNALPDADARVNMANGASLTFRIAAPAAHRGLGIEEYELRGDNLFVLRVIEHSPAGRAGIAAGDAIVAIGDRTVEDLGEAGAASALSMAADRQASLRVRKSDGGEEVVEVDRGYVWLTM